MQSQVRAGISLAKALRVERGAVVSLVGGGGKTTSMFRLAAELIASGLRVVTTTTTHISKDQGHFSPAFVVVDELASLTVRLDNYADLIATVPLSRAALPDSDPPADYGRLKK
jgi:probable selenium-dependent hydroxylase accessory protein YqeC